MDRIIDVRRSGDQAVVPFLGRQAREKNPHILSSVPRSILDITLRLKGRRLFCKAEIDLINVNLFHPVIGVLVAKNAEHASVYMDASMSHRARGSKIIEDIHTKLVGDQRPFNALACDMQVSEIVSSRTTDYHYFSIMMNQSKTPQALIIVQKAMLLCLLDDFIEDVIA